MRVKALILGLLLLSLCLAACGSPATSRPLVDYRRSGGIAGFDDHLVIQADGRAVLTRRGARHEFAVKREVLNDLSALLQEADFSRLRGEYLPASPCCDRFDYTVTYKGHSVHTMDGAVPEALAPVLQVLNQLIAESGLPAAG